MKRFNKIICIALVLCFVFILAGCNGIMIGEPTPPTTTTTTATTAESTTLTTAAATTTTATATTVNHGAATTTRKATTTTVQGYPYAYAGFDPTETDMNVPFNLILLNCDYKLPDGYTPKLAKVIDTSEETMDYRVAPFYRQMYEAALLDGITLTPVSGYRSVARQKRNFENYIAAYEKQGLSKADAAVKASQIVLLPGTSEHNAGLAMDICSLEVSFENTEEFRWLDAHAHEYGFIMRYPKDKTHVTKITYEPWHYRYVGVEVATELKSSGTVLEEYLGA